MVLPLVEGQVWTIRIGSDLNERVVGMDVSASGEIYALYTIGALWNLHGNTYVIEYDVVVMKVSSSGSISWTTKESSSVSVKPLSSYVSDTAVAIKVDSGENALVTGHTPNSFSGNTYVGGWDMFVLQVNGAGITQWVVQRGTTADEYVRAMLIDSSDSVIVAGETSGGLDGYSNAGGSDIFIVKLNSGGSWQWTLQTGSSGDDTVSSLQMDSSGAILVSGETQGDLSGNVNAGGNDAYVMKVNSGGSAVSWVVQRGTTADEYVRAMLIDSSDSVIVAGETSGGLDGYSNAGCSDIFIVKLNSGGSWQWTLQTGSSSDDTVSSLQMDSSGAILVSGETQGDLSGNVNAGGNDAYVMKVNSDGSILWTAQRGFRAWIHCCFLSGLKDFPSQFEKAIVCHSFFQSTTSTVQY